MKTIQIEIPDGKKAEWVNGVLTLIDETPQDITERIKTFEDACDWCRQNGKMCLVVSYDALVNDEIDRDIETYIKLRIIVAALNEGWEPTFEKSETRRCVGYGLDSLMPAPYLETTFVTIPKTLILKSESLVEYAAEQFKSIYLEFYNKL